MGRRKTGSADNTTPSLVPRLPLIGLPQMFRGLPLGHRGALLALAVTPFALLIFVALPIRKWLRRVRGSDAERYASPSTPCIPVGGCSGMKSYILVPSPPLLTPPPPGYEGR